MKRSIIDVFLLAQNRLLREALGKILQKKHDVRIVGASAFSAEVLKEIATASPQVLLFDSMSVALSGYEFIAEVRQALPEMKVVMIGMGHDREGFFRCVRAGVSGYVLEEASAVEVALAVRAVTDNEAVCPPGLCLALFEYLARQSSQLPSFHIKRQLGLTSREQQLVQMIGRGLTNKEIAARLNLAEQTVRNHVHRMLRKLSASDRLEVVERCRSEGLAV